MRKFIAVGFALSATLIIAACSNRDSTHIDRMVAMEAPGFYEHDAAESKQIEVDAEQVDLSNKKIIRDGEMTIMANDLAAAKRHVDSLVKSTNAYMASESFYKHSYEDSYRLKIRIPASNFDQFVAELNTGNNKIIDKNFEARDVTEQFTDIELRIENKRKYLKRYQELISQARSIKEILEIEQIIRPLEEEIESAEGRLRFLNNQVAYATLDLTISMKTEYKFSPDPQKNFFERIKKSLSGGWNALTGFVVAVLYLWPLAVVAGIVLLVVIGVKKKKRGSA